MLSMLRKYPFIFEADAQSFPVAIVMLSNNLSHTLSSERLRALDTQITTFFENLLFWQERLIKVSKYSGSVIFNANSKSACLVSVFMKSVEISEVQSVAEAFQPFPTRIQPYQTVDSHFYVCIYQRQCQFIHRYNTFSVIFY